MIGLNTTVNMLAKWKTHVFGNDLYIKKNKEASKVCKRVRLLKGGTKTKFIAFKSFAKQLY